MTPSVARPGTATEVASSPGLSSDNSSVPSLASFPAAKPNTAATAAATLADHGVETVESVDTNVKPPVAEVEIEGTIGVDPPGPSGRGEQNFGRRRAKSSANSGLPTDELKVEVESKAVDVDVEGVPNENANAASTDDAEDSGVVDGTTYEDDASIKTDRTETSAVIIRGLEKKLKAKKKENAVLTERLNQEQLRREEIDHAARLNQERAGPTPISFADKIRATGRLLCLLLSSPTILLGPLLLLALQASLLLKVVTVVLSAVMAVVMIPTKRTPPT